MIVKGSELLSKAISTGAGKNYPYTGSLSKSQLLKSPVIFIDGLAAETLKPGVEVSEDVITVKINDYKKMAQILELIASVYDDQSSDALDEEIASFEKTLEETR